MGLRKILAEWANTLKYLLKTFIASTFIYKTVSSTQALKQILFILRGCREKMALPSWIRLAFTTGGNSSGLGVELREII